MNELESQDSGSESVEPTPPVDSAPAPAPSPAPASQAPKVNADRYFQDLGGIHIDGNNRDMYQGLAESFSKSGHSAEAFKDALKYHQSFLSQTREELSSLDTQHASETRADLQSHWGSEFSENLNSVKRFFESLPPALRDGLQTARDDQGRNPLNDPETIKFLARLARGGSSSQPSGVDPATEREQLEALMRNRSEWNKSPERQARYRDLLAAGQGQAVAAPSSVNLDSEIKAIEESMRKNRAAYNKDENLQARYRKLLAQRAGITE